MKVRRENGEGERGRERSCKGERGLKRRDGGGSRRGWAEKAGSIKRMIDMNRERERAWMESGRRGRDGRRK